jgi:membrane protein required for colicin V production
MQYIDFILAIPLAWGAFMGFKKGLVLELATFAALALGVFGAIKFSDFTGGFLVQYIDISQEWLGLSSFMLTFILIVIGVFLFAKLLSKMLKIIALGLVNRLLGMIFGILKYALVLSILIYFYENLNQNFKFSEKKLAETSMLYQPIMWITEPITPLLENFSLEKISQQSDELLDQVPLGESGE